MKEKKNNYLAINKTSVSIKWLTIASLVYLLIYTEAGDIVTAFSELWAPILYLVIVCFLALGAKIFYKTDSVFIKLPKEGKVKILTIIFCIMLMALYFLMNLIASWAQVFNLMPEMMWSSICVALAAGIGEEFLCRVTLFNLFTKIFENKQYVLLWSSIFSSVLFGLFHLINSGHGAQLDATFQQVYYATAIGLAFSYLHIFTNRIWPCILMHFLLDLQPNIANMNAEASPWGPILIIFGIVIIVSIICIYAFNKRVNKVEN